MSNLFKYWTYQVFSPGTVLREKYEAFKSLLENDKRAHELMAELQEIHQEHLAVDSCRVAERYNALAACVAKIVENLNQITPSRYRELATFLKKIDAYVHYMDPKEVLEGSPPFVLALNDIAEDGQALTGGKAFNLAHIGQTLNIPVPDGFAVTTNGFYHFLAKNRLDIPIREHLARLDVRSVADLDHTAATLQAMIMAAPLPPDLERATRLGVDALAASQPVPLRLAVRSSALGEDGTVSFAGQYRSVLNVAPEDLSVAYKSVIASKYAPEALYYRIRQGFDDWLTPMAVLVITMVDASASGVMYTRSINTEDEKALAIHAIRGLGEILVQGRAAPDIFTLSPADRPEAIRHQPGKQSQQMVAGGEGPPRMEPISPDFSNQPVLSDEEVKTLADWGCRLEKHYATPMDVEWCRDRSGHLILLQARPLQTESRQVTEETCRLEDVSAPVLLSGGQRASAGLASGTVFKLASGGDLSAIPGKAVLVTKYASADKVRIMDRLNAVVTDTGSNTGHFASVAREFGVPMLVNTQNATILLDHGRRVTVDAYRKTVYDGEVAALADKTCVPRGLVASSPLDRRLTYMMDFVSPLRLVDPQAPNFAPGQVRSLHDIIRFAHEKCVQEMFAVGDRKFGRSMGTKKLITDIPMTIYLLDVGGGLIGGLRSKKAVDIESVVCEPMRMLWKGLSHPDIDWGTGRRHFDWAEYDKIVMQGGIISADAAMLSSYAVVAADYVNLNLKFGYHFVVIDAIVDTDKQDNYLLFRFSGGGADVEGRSLRSAFLRQVLERMEFEVTTRFDLVDAQFGQADAAQMQERLDMLGRLLGATRLMDMYLKNAEQIPGFVDDFYRGRFSFATVKE
jgi:pyruvate,water dikinase